MQRNQATTKNRRRGLALIVVLWIVVLLAVVVTTVGKTTRLDTRVCRSSAAQIRGKWALKAGVEKAIAVLNDDSRDGDSLNDIWSEESENTVDLSGCELRVTIVDEAGKLNINTVTREELMFLPEMTAELADSIIDWRDKDDKPNLNGAERGYYFNLEYSYPIRNGNFRTLRELQLVKGGTEKLLYEREESPGVNNELTKESAIGNVLSGTSRSGAEKRLIDFLTCYSYDNNKDATESDRVNINKADEKKLTGSLDLYKSHAKWIMDNRKNGFKSIADLINEKSKKESSKEDAQTKDARPLDLETFKSIADKITVHESKQIPGLVNINTASKEVLLGLFRGNHELAAEVVSYRNGLSGGMDSIADILEVKGMTIKIFKNIANLVTVRSNIFNVQCRAVSRDTKAEYRVEAVVDRSNSPSVIVYWYQGAGH